MAEDDSKGNGRSRFKSKWGKILKHSDDVKGVADAVTGKKNKHANSQEDVDAFLKPSVDRAAANKPRLDVSIAQRWPDPDDVRQAGVLPPDDSRNVNGWRKSRRKEGLTVGFAKTVPEIIGHGGDETMDPPSDVAARKASAAWNRSVIQGGRPPMPTQQSSEAPRLPPIGGATISPQSGVSPPPDHNRFDVNGQEPLPPRIGISRAPTGFSHEDEAWSPISESDSPPALPSLPQMMNDRLDPQPQNPGATGQLRVSPTPRDPHTLVAKKQHDMREGEGMALRRASAMIEPFDFQDSDDLTLGVHAAATATDRAEAAATPPVNAVDREPTLPSVDLPSPQSDASVDSPSPFADVKYIKRHSREVSVGSAGSQVQQVPLISAPRQGAKSPFADPKYLNSRSREASPSRPIKMEEKSSVESVVQRLREPSLNYLEPDQTERVTISAPLEDATATSRFQNNQTSYMVPQGPRQAPQSHNTALHSDEPQRSGRSLEQPSYMKAAYSADSENLSPSIARPLPASRAAAASRGATDNRDPSPLRDRLFHTPMTTQQQPTIFSRPNGSNVSLNRFAPPTGSHSRDNSYERIVPQPMQRGSVDMGPPPPPHLTPSRTTSPSSPPQAVPPAKASTHLTAHPNDSAHSGSSQSQLGVPTVSPYARGPSPNDYFNVQRQPPTQTLSSRSRAGSLVPPEASRPGSAHSTTSLMRPTPPAQTPSSSNVAAAAAFEDFAGRVAHMKGVFRLTAEKEQPAERCTPPMWLRAAYWWYLRGKIGLESALQQRARSRETEHRELLLQPHVDLAKTSWMLTDPLERYDEATPPDARNPSAAETLLRQDYKILKDHLKSLSYSMQRNNIMPPPQSLIQGQDTQIWLEYPRFTPDAAAVLGGADDQRSLIVDSPGRIASPSETLPLGDSADYHYYTRSTVNLSLNTDDVNTDRVSIPCTLTVLRGRREYQSTVVIASQNELVYLKIAPRQSNTSHLTWGDVSWKASSLAVSINLPRGMNVTVRFFEHDFRSLWNLVEYSRRIDHSMRPDRGEVQIHEVKLVEVQYADSSNPNAFPQDKVKHCRALVWERLEDSQHGGTVRRKHRGFRLAVATESGQKSLSSFSQELCVGAPLFFEFITDAAAHGTTAMVIRTREERKQCRMLLVFEDMESRQTFYNTLNGIDVRQDETIVGKMTLTGLSIVAMADALDGSSSGQGELPGMQWQRLGVTNTFTEDSISRLPSTIESENLRIIARHDHGCITDRLNLDKGELLFRLPCTETPAVQILRQPQADLTMSIDTRNTPHNVADAEAGVYKVAQSMPTIRTFTFATPNDLHDFQTAITGFTVRYDGLASALAISRRRMVVPIYHKWTATKVRLQIVANAQNTVTQLLAFMEDFAHAEMLCFQIKSTDVFETVKGDGKNKKWAVKMVDAKFSLPAAVSKGDEPGVEEKARRRFVNLEGLDYAQEHDDITVGFDSEEARDDFAKALPAATTVGRMITLKRRI